MITSRLLPLVAALPLLLLPASARAQSSTAFAQLAGPTGCLTTPDGYSEVVDGCAVVAALDGAAAIAVAPDGRDVYVSGTARRAAFGGTLGVTDLRRDPGSGGLVFASCVTDDGGDGRLGSEGLCADGDALDSVSDLAFSPDGAFLYAASPGSSAVSWFARDPATGALTQLGCIKQLVRPGERCTQANALAGATGVAVSPDGAHVYVAAANSSSVAVFRRDAASGALTPQSCVSETGGDGACGRAPGMTGASTLSEAPDGRALYVLGAGSIATLAVDPATGDLAAHGCLLAHAPEGGACTETALIDQPLDAQLTPDGRSLLVITESDRLVNLARDASTGALTPSQCFVESEHDVAPDGDAVCKPARWDDALTLAVSPDGRGVFIGGGTDVGAYRRDAATGRLTQFACLNDTDDGLDDRCGAAHRIEFSTAMAASADGRNLYITNDTGSVSVLETTVAIASDALRAHAGRVRVGLACPAARREGCAGRLNGARFALAAGRHGSVSLRLSKRALRRGHVLLTARMKAVTATRRVRVR